VDVIEVMVAYGQKPVMSSLTPE